MSGVRSSCDASATNRRSRASDAVRSAKACFDLAEHRVEREAEPADLGALVGGFDPARQVAGRDRAGGLAHLLERTQPELHDPPREQREREQHAGGDEHLDQQEMVQRVVDVAHRDGDDERAGYRTGSRTRRERSRAVTVATR